MTDAHDVVADAFRTEWGRVVATLIRSTGDWDLAEECAQEAFAEAVRRWPRDGVPDRPGAWLTTVGRNRALDRLRRAKVEDAKLQELARMPSPTSEESGSSEVPDDRLRLIFTCCHPALALDARVALALRTLVGLTTREIAAAFLVTEQTMAKRLVRAKKKIHAAGIPYRVPGAELLPERTAGVLAVVYLLFSQGYSASGVELIRAQLCDEALRLARLLVTLLPDDPEVLGLTALLLLQDSRRTARVVAGELVQLEHQDRSSWNHDQIREAVALLDQAMKMGSPGVYQLQAAIAACHAMAPTAQETDWVRIEALYGRLAELTSSPVVALNRAVAVAKADGPALALRIVDDLAAAGELDDYYLLSATRAHLLRQLGRAEEAVGEYHHAAQLAPTDTERRFLQRQIAETSPVARRREGDSGSFNAAERSDRADGDGIGKS
jgi:RNA polymerase sigma-70 factor, ECF subfamily